MNIAFDLVAIERLDDGMYTSSLALLQGLQRVPAAHRYLLLTGRPERYIAFTKDERFEVIHAPIPVLQRDAVLLEHQLLEPLALRRLHPHVLHAPGLASPLLWHGPTVLTLHDVAFLSMPEQMSRASLYYWRYVALPSARRATRIVTVSHHARQEIARELHLPLERIQTVYNSIGDQFTADIAPERVERVRARYHLTGQYILFVSTLQARKNVTALIRAFERLAPALPDVQLVLAGGISANSEAIIRDAEQSPVAARIRLTGRVDYDDLPALYAGARVFALPSKQEGFGLTMIEAMACGTPVVANNASCLPEVAGDAALLMEADDASAFAAALRRALGDEALRQTLIARGFQRSALFRPEICAEQMLEVYEQAANQGAKSAARSAAQSARGSG
ncbi:MAG TPA: glycosyltransferase family 1 protein [Ktedonobacterales bacterium]|nr:glycosyltransferase family 1 protein [Ktedonobacterales bacterium]